MDYRLLPRGKQQIYPLGVGLGAFQNNTDYDITKTIKKAIDNGINFFDLCCGAKNIYEPFGKAIAPNREKVLMQVHFGAVYNDKGEYGLSRDIEEIKKTFAWELKSLNTDYVDFGMLHCIDQDDDLDLIISSGLIDYVKQLKAEGIVKHIGFSSHTPSVAMKLLDLGICDIMMFSLNPAYDLEKGDEYGIGTTNERNELLIRCLKEGVAVSVMKPFHGGQLLNEATSPFKVKMSIAQCLKYALDRPAVVTVLPGIAKPEDLDTLLSSIAETDVDYSVIGQYVLNNVIGNCVYCNHCLPCPKGIDIGLVNKYYDLAKSNDVLAKDHYLKLTINASNCINCHHCDKRCPFKVKQSARMKEIAAFFSDLS